jgi:glycine cleavage system H protein
VTYLILACTGLDKPEGSVAREVAMRLAEEAGAEIVCPVVLNRTPARYKKALAGNRLVVVDGCATRCAGKLAATAGAKPVRKIVVSEALKETGRALAPELRLGPDALELARTIADQIVAAEATALKPAEGGTRSTDSDFESPADFTVVVHDKYEFRIPLTGYFFNANDVWAQVAGTRARIGISDYMQQRLTDITYVDPPKEGAIIAQFDEAGTVESTKANFEIVSPVSGTVVRINDAVTDAPESINEDPYGSWIAELEMSAWEEDRVLLVDGPAYAADVERKAAEDQDKGAP